MDSEGLIFVNDPDAIIREVDGQHIIFTIDELAFIDDLGQVWTPYGETPLSGIPEYTQESLEAAGFGEVSNPQQGAAAAATEGPTIVLTGQTVVRDNG